MNANALLTPPATGLLPENVTVPVAHEGMNGFDREFTGIVKNYGTTVYGQSREAELTAVERTLIKPVSAAGALAVGRYSVGPKQSTDAEARIAYHNDWVDSDERKLALGEMLAMQAIVDEARAYAQMQREAARWIASLSEYDKEDEEDDKDGEHDSSNRRSRAKRPRSNFSLVA